MTLIAPHIEAFLREYLGQQRGASEHTCDSYAYSFQGLFEFAAGRLKVQPSALRLEQLDATLIAAFLQHLEADRGNSAQTRNVRLAAIRSFFRFVQHREPAALEQIRRVLAIPFKRTDTRLVAHFDRDEVQALLDAQTAGALAHAAVVAVVSDRADAYGLQRALQHGIAAAYVPLSRPRNAAARSAWEAQISAVVAAFQPDLVLLSGFMSPSFFTPACESTTLIFFSATSCVPASMPRI